MSCLSSARFGLLLAGMISAGLSAATLSPADQNAIEQQQKALLEQTQQQRDMLRYSTPAPSLPETPPPEAAGPCFELRYIQLENVTALPLSAQRKLIRLPAEGCMTLQDIRQRVRDVTQDYLSRGFITSRAWLPEQDISGGTLVIAVTEGKVETLTLDGHQENALRMVFPRAEGQILNLRDTEQGLEQLNRLNSRSLTVDILPGSREGFSRVELVPVSQRFPVSLDVGADNSGQKSTGSGQMNARLTADNLLGLADQWTLAAGRDSEYHHDRRSRSMQGAFRFLTDTGCSARSMRGLIFIRRFPSVSPRCAGAMKAPCSHNDWRPAGHYCGTVSNVWRWIWPCPAGKPKTGWAAYALTSAARPSAV